MHTLNRKIAYYKQKFNNLPEYLEYDTAALLKSITLDKTKMNRRSYSAKSKLQLSTFKLF